MASLEAASIARMECLRDPLSRMTPWEIDRLMGKGSGNLIVERFSVHRMARRSIWMLLRTLRLGERGRRRRVDRDHARDEAGADGS